MQCDYKKEASRTFLKVRDECLTDTETFSMRMLCGGILPGMLRCHLKTVDGENCMYYDVTGLQTLRTTYQGRKLRFAEIRFILEECISVIEELEDYLLIPDQLLLEPDHIFVNPERTKMFFCCFPGAFQDIRVQLSGLAEYILPGIDHNDRKGMSAGYGFYRSVIDDTIPINELREAIYTPDSSPEEPFSAEAIRDVPSDRQESEILWNESFTREGYKTEDKKPDGRGERSRLIFHGLLYAGAALAIFAAAALYRLFCPGDLRLDKWIAAAFICPAVGLLMYRGIQYIWGKNRKNRVRDNAKGLKKRYDEKRYDEKGQNLPLSVEEPHPSEEIYTELSSFAGYKRGDESFTEAVFADARTPERCPELIPEDPAFPHISLCEKLILIGSLPGAVDIVLRAPAVSRIHARIMKKGDKYYITDLHSKNGTLLNDTYLENEAEKLLENDDRVQFANVSYKVTGICPA